MRLKDKTALVSAAGAGIGLASVRLFASEGASVTAVDINADSLVPLAAEGITTRQLDVTDPRACAHWRKTWAQLTFSSNCAGFVDHGTILDCGQEEFDFSMNLNVAAMYRITRAFLPAMIEAGGGNIINMSSILSSIIGAPNRFIYTATKAAVIGMTKSIAADSSPAASAATPSARERSIRLPWKAGFALSGELRGSACQFHFPAARGTPRPTGGSGGAGALSRQR